jgi:simple sugar transport system ATP-binding protein
LQSGIGMLYQEPLDFPPFRIVENYLLGRDRRVRLDYKTAEAELKQLASRYNFKLDYEAFVDSLSLGERQQLELVRLLAGGAQVLILDEPTTGISAEQKELLFDSMRRLAHEEGKTLILVSHKLSEVQELCDHALCCGGKAGGRDRYTLSKREIGRDDVCPDSAATTHQMIDSNLHLS